MEKILRVISEVSEAIRQHSLSQKAREGWSAGERKRYSLFQLGTAIMWPGFLSSASGVVQNAKLKRALRLNAACEIGATEGSKGHAVMAREFCLSQGFIPSELYAWAWSPASQENIKNMSEILAQSEEFIAGRFLAGESFAAVIFEVFQPAFSQITGCDTTYMSEHVEVDTDEHSRLLLEAIEDILLHGGSEEEVMRGIHAGAKFRMDYLAYLEDPSQEE
jgi:hypothetical protein